MTIPIGFFSAAVVEIWTRSEAKKNKTKTNGKKTDGGSETRRNFPFNSITRKRKPTQAEREQFTVSRERLDKRIHVGKVRVLVEAHIYDTNFADL